MDCKLESASHYAGCECHEEHWREQLAAANEARERAIDRAETLTEQRLEAETHALALETDIDDERVACDALTSENEAFDFPYTMYGDTCPTCGAARDAIDGRSLRAAREACKTSLRELARRIGLSATYLSHVERNQRTVTQKVLRLYKRGLA